MNDTSISILGELYTIYIRRTEDDANLKDSDGYTDFSAKEIVMRDINSISFTIKNPMVYWNKVLRHEILHAFIRESGICEYFDEMDEEQIVDWVAYQFPKIQKVYEGLGIL